MHLGIYIWEDVHDILLSEKKQRTKKPLNSYHGEICLDGYTSKCREGCGETV